jgi:SAM-dependent methyltransferase
VNCSSYPGQELEVFRHARNWKAYWSGVARRYLRGNALEVGAGIGANVPLLHDAARRWTFLEPDPQLCGELRQELEAPEYSHCEAVCCSVRDLSADLQFDSILYIDVLEHIPDDAAELAEAASRLKPRGHLIVLVPAHQSLFTPFDKAIGHQRRYNVQSLSACAPAGLRTEAVQYMDSVGLLASLANRWVMRQSAPTQRQINTWDRLMIPFSRWIDPLLGYRFGKSLLAVWSKD